MVKKCYILICISQITNEIECNFLGLLASIFFPEYDLLNIFSFAYFLSILSETHNKICMAKITWLNLFQKNPVS